MDNRSVLIAILLAGIVLTLAESAGALTIRSWDDGNQEGGDLSGAGTGTMQYSTLEDALLAADHTILPGVSTLTVANLAEVELFFHGTSTHVLTSAEQAALAGFVMAGGTLIVEVDSRPETRASGNSSLGALGLGTPYDGATGGTASPTAGQFSSATTATTVGPFGDIRVLQFGSSIVADLNWEIPSGVLIGYLGVLESIVEYTPFPNGGDVLACGASYGFNLFLREGEELHNPSNAIAYLNFIAGQVSTPVEAATWGAIKLSFRDTSR